jgi:hypothetical protein
MAHCKTSMLAGVYFTRDMIEVSANRPDEDSDLLKEENRQLREEMERLKGGGHNNAMNSDAHPSRR